MKLFLILLSALLMLMSSSATAQTSKKLKGPGDGLATLNATQMNDFRVFGGSTIVNSQAQVQGLLIGNPDLTTTSDIFRYKPIKPREGTPTIGCLISGQCGTYEGLPKVKESGEIFNSSASRQATPFCGRPRMCIMVTNCDVKCPEPGNPNKTCCVRTQDCSMSDPPPAC